MVVLDTLNVKIHPLFQNLLVFLMEARKWEKSEESEHGGGGTEEESYSYRRGYCNDINSSYISLLESLLDGYYYYREHPLLYE